MVVVLIISVFEFPVLSRKLQKIKRCDKDEKHAQIETPVCINNNV